MFQNQKDIPFGIERKLQIQHESCGWTLYSERAHVENIFYSRFNYFMLIFTLFVSVIVAVYVSDDVNHKGCTIFFLSLWGSFILGYLEYTLIKTFKVLGCSGVIRIDFMIDKDTNAIYVNEVNTIPGCTSHSRYPSMLNKIGISFPKVIDKLIKLGLER